MAERVRRLPCFATDGATLRMMDFEQLRTGAAVAGTGAAIYKALAERAARQRAGAEAAVEHGIAIEAELRELLGPARFDPHRELIVVDAARANRYPAPDEKFRLFSVSPWFKSEGRRFYSGGLEVGEPRLQRIAIRRGKAEVVRQGGELAVLAMRIPFKNIIACAPYDDAFGLPLLYCHFDCGRHLPYESVEVYRRTPTGLEHLEDVAFKNRVTLREVRDVPSRIRSELAQKRFDREIRARRREMSSMS